MCTLGYYILRSMVLTQLLVLRFLLTREISNAIYMGAVSPKSSIIIQILLTFKIVIFVCFTTI